MTSQTDRYSSVPQSTCTSPGCICLPNIIPSAALMNRLSWRYGHIEQIAQAEAIWALNGAG
jgi:hypothetical protein